MRHKKVVQGHPEERATIEPCAWGQPLSVAWYGEGLATLGNGMATECVEHLLRIPLSAPLKPSRPYGRCPKS